MKLKGQRQSKNVDDIRKQKPKLTNGSDMVARDVAGNKVGGGSQTIKMATVSKKPADMREFQYNDRGVKMAKKIGMHKMESAAAADHEKNEANAAKREKSLEAILADPRNQEDGGQEPADLKSQIWAPKKQGTNY
jgi:hypothetical protein